MIYSRYYAHYGIHDNIRILKILPSSLSPLLKLADWNIYKDIVDIKNVYFIKLILDLNEWVDVHALRPGTILFNSFVRIEFLHSPF